MVKKFFVTFLVLMAVAALFIGCAPREGDLIGIAMPETHVMRWVQDGLALEREAVARGFRAELQFGDANQAVQNQQLQSFITQGARLLVVGNINDGVASVVAEAAREGIHVIAYDRIIQNSADYDFFITFNNFKVGVLQAESLVQGLNLEAATADAPKYITLFAGSPTDGNAFFFFDGAMSVLNPFIDRGVLRVAGPHPRSSADTAAFMRIATEGWQAPIAKARMESLLITDARDVTLDAVLAPNDTLARAIIEALLADARYINNLPLVTGQDAEFASAMSIARGQQFSTVFKDTAKLAEATMILAEQILSGVPFDEIEVPNTVLATGDLAEIGWTGLKYVNTFLLEPILVTRENLMVPVDAGFYDFGDAALLRAELAN